MSSFKTIKTHHIDRGKGCKKRFWESLRQLNIINFKKNQVKLLTNEQQGSYENTKTCYICKEQFENKHVKDKKYCKIRDHCHLQENL